MELRREKVAGRSTLEPEMYVKAHGVSLYSFFIDLSSLVLCSAELNKKIIKDSDVSNLAYV